MNERNSGKRVLLLIDNIKTLFRSLSSFRGKEANFNSFKLEMEMQLGKEISKKYVEGYFYSATMFHLLVPQSFRGNYRLSATAILLCSLYKNAEEKSEYQKILSTLLLTNERKGELFRSFLDYVSSPKIEDQIYKEFGQVTGKSLILWGTEAGLAIRHGNIVGKVIQEERHIHPSLEAFKEELKSAYQEMQSADFFGIDRMFVDIEELRLRVACKLNFADPQEFDSYLEKLLESNFGKNISLHGAPPHIVEKKKYMFKHEGSEYIYISLKG